MTNLLEILEEANSLNIDDNFCRYFDLEDEGVDEDEDENTAVLLRLSFEVDNNLWEYEFTRGNLINAAKNPVGGWDVVSTHSEMSGIATITPCMVTELG